MELYVDRMASPLGMLILLWREDALCGLGFGDGSGQGTARHAPECIRGPLERYFAGEVDAIDEIRVEAEGTPFQKEVWRALRGIPAGSTMSYGELAERIGRPGASRAVGMANRTNPVGLVVPCHRVVGSDGTLTGYAGGLERKRWLLEHERAHRPLAMQR